MSVFTSRETKECTNSTINQQVQEIKVPNNEDTTFEGAAIITEYPEK